MSGNRRKIATKPYDFVKAEDLEKRIVEYDRTVAEAFKKRFKAHDEQIREDVDDLFAQQHAFLYVVVGGTAAALAIAVVALVLAVS